MTTELKKTVPRLSIFRNWVSLAGLLMVGGSLFAFLFLLILEVMTGTTNPYIGILAFLILPGFLVMGLVVIGIGLYMERRKVTQSLDGQLPPLLLVDFSQPHTRRNIFVFTGAGLMIILFTVIMMYRGYHFTESSQFCGQSCHTVMQPEYTTYQHSPHARLACAECHIGSGASWYVKAKVSGLRQVYAVALNKFSRPITTPVKNLRPAQDTCEQCHWPSKFVGNLDRSYVHFLADKTNTPFSVRLLLKVGGGDPTHGPVGGIHWHMNVGNHVEYIAKDDQHQVIPWVRLTDRQGVVTEYKTAGFKPDPAKDVIQIMDCMDCHNRPSHIFQSPDAAVDMALSLGKLDPTMPNIKKTAVQVLTEPYTTNQEAMQKIATRLHAEYSSDPRYQGAIDVVQDIYRNNFFPEMKTNWKTHPNNLGHKEFLGCFRCHDGDHKTADGKQSIKANDCNACHTIVAQGQGKELDNLSAKGHPFAHPGGEIDGGQCSECHTGGPQ